MLTIQTLADDNAEKLGLIWLAGRAGGERGLADDYLAPSDRVGHLNLIHPTRIQVFGHREMTYYLRFDINRRLHHFEDLLSGGVPALVVAEGLVPQKISSRTATPTACRCWAHRSTPPN